MTPEQATASGAVLFDRDGTLVADVPYNGDPDRVVPVEGALEALSMLRAAGLALGIVSNQSGVARGLIDRDQVDAVNRRIEDLLGPFDVVVYCAHGPDDGCDCRKPRSGLIRQACERLGIAPSKCVVVGDIGSDVEAALAVGAKAVLVPTPATLEHEVEWAREHPDVTVVPNITQAVRVVLNDGLGVGRVSRQTAARALNPVADDDIGARHIRELTTALSANGPALTRAQAWGELLVEAFDRGNKVLAAGNGGSAAEAAHLVAELVGRYSSSRPALPAIALPADMSSITAIANDFGVDDVFARPLSALCAERDIVLLMSTSGRSPNVLAAAAAARRRGATVWAMTGPTPNPLADLADDVMAVEAGSTAIIQEVHLAAVHVIAESVDRAIEAAAATPQDPSATRSVIDLRSTSVTPLSGR